ncbi:hypothetical protein BX666DRAFT_1964628 [Dichotomocladium elegans]|nr:hypothetical protein BX666DRAFT_1964628 [Dichotomocladium elegans]
MASALITSLDRTGHEEISSQYIAVDPSRRYHVPENPTVIEPRQFRHTKSQQDKERKSKKFRSVEATAQGTTALAKLHTGAG